MLTGHTINGRATRADEVGSCHRSCVQPLCLPITSELTEPSGHSAEGPQVLGGVLGVWSGRIGLLIGQVCRFRKSTQLQSPLAFDHHVGQAASC